MLLSSEVDIRGVELQERPAGGKVGAGSPEKALLPQELLLLCRTAIAQCKLSPDCHQPKKQKARYELHSGLSLFEEV